MTHVLELPEKIPKEVIITMFHEVMVNILERNGKIEIFSKVIKKKQAEMLALKNIESADLNKTINPLDIIDIYRNFQATTTKTHYC